MAFILNVTQLKESQILQEYIKDKERGNVSQHKYYYRNEYSLNLTIIAQLLLEERTFHKPRYKDTGKHCTQRHNDISSNSIVNIDERGNPCR